MTAPAPGQASRNARPVGRFAPTPSGPLHFGSLVAALGSYLQARARGGLWKLRIDDLDTPRVIPGAIDTILRQLEACALHWDDAVLYQSCRGEAYSAALAQLDTAGLLYPCACSRRELRERGLPGPFGPVYPGTCRNGLPHGRTARALRVRVPADAVCIDDALQGRYCQNLARDIGDFVVRRADGIVAYQLATVLDDAWQGVTEVVRGHDLLDSTPRQRYLIERLGLPLPTWMHLPVVVDRAGLKLAKQNRARPIPLDHPAPWMIAALRVLGLQPESDLEHAAPAEIVAWAGEHWQPKQLQGRTTVTLPDGLPLAGD